MLKLEKMELIGFKSFSGRTEVKFPEGITAVVGPNGCGKSNIGDAISWVLGEQSAKSLRGGKMEDIIFNGSEQMKPMGMAEVSLRLVHDNGASGNGQDEIILTRRLFRSGESEYSLNGERCRLKDITDLLSQSRIGAKSCAVIEQGRVEEIMNARPIERRLIIEEAAGIIGYKGKRKIAETKLEATRGNLLRVQDIVNEVERQMRSLKRQASRARRYSRLKEAIREKQAVLFIRKSQKLLSERSELEEVLDKLKEEEAERLAQMGVIEATLERGRQELTQAEDGYSKMVEQMHVLDKKIHEEEASSKSAEEKVLEIQSANTKMLENREAYLDRISHMEKLLAEKLDEESAVLKEKESFQFQLREHEKTLSAVKEKEIQISKTLEEERKHFFREASALSEMKNSTKMHDMEKKKLDISLEKKGRELEEEEKNILAIKESLVHLETKKTASEQKLEALRSHRESLAQEMEELNQYLQKNEQNLLELRVLLNSLREKESIYKNPEVVSEATDAGIQAILDGKISLKRGHTGLAANGIRSAEPFENAVKGYLVEILPALCVKTVEEAIDGMKLLKKEKAGSGKFMFIDERHRFAKEVEIPMRIQSHERFMGKLSEKVRCENGIEKNLKQILDRCIVVQDIDAALMFYQWQSDLDYVTLDGDVIRSREGLVHHTKEGSRERLLLALNNRRESILKEIEKTEADIAVQSQDLQEMRKKLSGKEKEEQELLEKARELEKEWFSMENEEKRHLERLAYMKKKEEILREEFAILEKEKKSATDHCEEARCSAMTAEEDFSRNEEKIDRLKEESSRLQEEISEKSKEMSSLYRQYAECSGKMASLQTDVMHLKENLKDLKNRVEETRREESSGHDKIRELKSSKNIAKEAVERMVQQRMQSQMQSEKLREEINSRKESLSLQEQEIKQIRIKLDEVRLALREKEIEKTEIQGDIKHNTEACYQELSKEIKDLDEPAALLEEINDQGLALEISELQEKIQRIGPVNMMAVEEYSKLEERFQFLSKQRKDLTDSIESLTETIRKINRNSREKFHEAFQGINEGFNEIFKVLFNGGCSELRLEDGSDILESGIEIIAQPPGKKLQNMNLLSGGEKALTVIALLFAVFRFQPSPFCLLDEVDSALDDVNISKFINMLRNFSDKTQFILITHNKKTMEVANFLYGVTMEEPGISKVVSLKLN